jgi:hypothetical protein
MQGRLAILAVASMLVSCGDDAGVPDAMAVDAAVSDAAVSDAADDATGDAAPDARADATDDAASDATPDACTEAPQVVSVARADGGREARQGSTVELVVTGARLAGTTAVTLGPLPATIVSASDTELRVTVAIPHGQPPSSLALEVTSPGGTTSVPDAIATTYFIVAPGASGGRGTHESPLGICDADVADADPVDRLVLLAGRHTSSCLLHTSAPIVGAGSDRTVVAISIDTRTSSAGMSIAGLTFDSGPVDRPVIFIEGEDGGFVALDDVVFDRPANAIELWSGGALTVTDLYYSGSGTAISAQGELTITDSTIDGCATGIRLTTRSLVVQNTTIQNCTTGVDVGVPMSAFPGRSPPVEIVDSVLRNNLTGVLMASGEVELQGAMIIDDGTVTSTPTVGVRIFAGYVHVRASAVTATGIAIETVHLDCISGSGVMLDDADIEGGDVAVHHASCEQGQVHARRSRLRGRNAGLVIATRDDLYDLGNPSSPGDNDLSVTSPTGYALIDHRDLAEPITHVTMTGTTLNGRSYAGQTIIGPADVVPDYLLTGEDIVDF